MELRRAARPVVLRLSLGAGGEVSAALEAHALPGLPPTARTLTSNPNSNPNPYPNPNPNPSLTLTLLTRRAP